MGTTKFYCEQKSKENLLISSLSAENSYNFLKAITIKRAIKETSKKLIPKMKQKRTITMPCKGQKRKV